MTRLTEQTRMRLVMMHGLAMLGLGAALLFVRASMVNVLRYILGCAISILLVMGSLLFTAALDWLCAASMGAQQIHALRGLLILSACAAGAGLFLVFYPGSTIPLLAYVVAAYAFLLSIGKFRVARFWMGTKLEQLLMYGLATVALLLSAALVYVARQDERDVLAVIASYSLFVGLQMLLSIFYLHSNLATRGAARRSSHAQI